MRAPRASRSSLYRQSPSSRRPGSRVMASWPRFRSRSTCPCCPQCSRSSEPSAAADPARPRGAMQGTARARARPISRPLVNRQLAELLARAAEASEGNKQRAFRRAARRALLWPIEAADLVAEGRSLTELVAVGPFVGGQIHHWLRDPPGLPDPPPSPAGFIS